MGGARALIASIGASISMVAAAALSLLVVTLVFAIDGFTGAAGEPTARAAFVIKAQPRAETEVQERRTQALVVSRAAPVPETRPAPARESALPREPRSVDAVEASQPSFDPRVRDIGPGTSTPADTTDDSSSAPGDGVREVGEAVTSTLSGTGAAAGDSLPLGPPVTQAVQDVLDVVIGLLEGATSGLAGTLDKTAR
jgi:hypothetical protein